MSSSLSTSRSPIQQNPADLLRVAPPVVDDLDDVHEITERNPQLRRERSAALTAQLLEAD